MITIEAPAWSYWLLVALISVDAFLSAGNLYFRLKISQQNDRNYQKMDELKHGGGADG